MFWEYVFGQLSQQLLVDLLWVCSFTSQLSRGWYQCRPMVPKARESILSEHFSKAEGGPLCPQPLKGAYMPALIISKQAEGSAGSWEGEVWQMWASEWVIEENREMFLSRWPLPLFFSPQEEAGVRNVLSESGHLFSSRSLGQPCNLLHSFFFVSGGGCSWSDKSGNLLK